LGAKSTREKAKPAEKDQQHDRENNNKQRRGEKIG